MFTPLSLLNIEQSNTGQLNLARKNKMGVITVDLSKAFHTPNHKVVIKIFGALV